MQSHPIKASNYYLMTQAYEITVCRTFW